MNLSIVICPATRASLLVPNKTRNILSPFCFPRFKLSIQIYVHIPRICKSVCTFTLNYVLRKWGHWNITFDYKLFEGVKTKDENDFLVIIRSAMGCILFKLEANTLLILYKTDREIIM